MDTYRKYSEAADALLAELTLLRDSGVEFIHYPKESGKPELPIKEALLALKAVFKPCKRCGAKNPPELIYGEPGEKTRLVVVVESSALLTPEEDGTLRKIIEHEKALSLTPEEVCVIRAPSKCVSIEEDALPEPSSCTGFVRRALKTLAPEMIMIMGISSARAIMGEGAELSSINALYGIKTMPTHSLASIMADKEAKMTLFMDIKSVKTALSR